MKRKGRNLLCISDSKRFNNQGWFLSRLLFVVLVIAAFLILLLFYNKEKPPIISPYSNETEEFRSMMLTGKLTECWEDIQTQTEDSRWHILAVLMAASDFYTEPDKMKKFCPRSLEEYDALSEFYETKQNSELQLLEQSYETLLADLVYFPVMKSSRQTGCGVSYADSWLAERAYQNTSHAHEGTDIMALNNERGYYPIVSMTDGVVENLGWLEKGGYRIGIRSPHGAYIYYAHLYRYADGLEKGDTVKAGQLLGFMGDSGYSKVEGTVGNFDVHLHLGIYMKTEHHEELSVNPYWILKRIEEKVVIGDY